MKSLCTIKEAKLLADGKEYADEKPVFSISILEYRSEFSSVKFRTIFDGFCYNWLPLNMYQYSLFGNSLERTWLFQERGLYL